MGVDTLIGWIILSIAVVGYLACYRTAYRFFRDDDTLGGDDHVDRVMAVVMAMLTSLFWPLVLFGYGLWLFATPTTAHERRAQIKAMEDRKRQLQDDIARLERETRESDHK